MDNKELENKLMEVGYKILLQYQTIFDLECNNLDISNNVKIIKKLLREETDLYSYVTSSDEAEFMFNEYMKKRSSNLSDDLIYRRMCDNLFRLIYLRKYNEPDAMMSSVIEESFETDFDLVAFTLMEQSKDLDLENRLKVKYNLLFTKPSFEKTIIDNNFKMDEYAYVSSQLITDAIGIMPDMVKVIKDDYMLRRIGRTIELLINMKDENVFNNSALCRIFTNTHYLRAGLTLIDLDTKASLEEQFIKEKDNLSEPTYYLILDCFYEKDNEKVIKLSFRK